MIQGGQVGAKPVSLGQRVGLFQVFPTATVLSDSDGALELRVDTQRKAAVLRIALTLTVEFA